ncbi:MAG TPA: cation diffusion facilitator family transporter [Bacteroidales bacterium]|nr:cation diffusion facilitator family transporter [Bacteroidales bacterium]
MEGEKKRVAFLSVLAAVFLTSFKFFIGIVTGSLGILSEALHSGIDLIAAVITFLSVRVSDKPADFDHNYGHGKIENISALAETILLLVTCFWIILEAYRRLASGHTHIDVTVWSYVVVISSIIIDFSRSRALYRVARKHNSQALEADALHFSTDIWSSVVVLLGLICANFGLYIADPVAALGVAIVVLTVSYRLGKRAVDVLLDKAPPDIVRKVRQMLDSYPEVIHFHSLKVRTAGADTFIKFNIHLKPYLSLRKVHELCDRIERDIRSRIPRSEIYIHAEPQDIDHLLAEEAELADQQAVR